MYIALQGHQGSKIVSGAVAGCFCPLTLYDTLRLQLCKPLSAWTCRVLLETSACKFQILHLPYFQAVHLRMAFSVGESSTNHWHSVDSVSVRLSVIRATTNTSMLILNLCLYLVELFHLLCCFLCSTRVWVWTSSILHPSGPNLHGAQAQGTRPDTHQVRRNTMGLYVCVYIYI